MTSCDASEAALFYPLLSLDIFHLSLLSPIRHHYLHVQVTLKVFNSYPYFCEAVVISIKWLPTSPSSTKLSISTEPKYAFSDYYQQIEVGTWQEPLPSMTLSTALNTELSLTHGASLIRLGRSLSKEKASPFVRIYGNS